MDHKGSESPDRSVVARDLQDEIDSLRQRLNEASSKLMQLLSPAGQITDTEIERKIESLQDAIQWWINAIEQDLRKQSQDFGSLFRHLFSDKHAAQYLRTLGICKDSACAADSEWVLWLGGLSTSIYVVLSRHIWVYLDDEVFSDKYPVGVSTDSTKIFDDILSVMRGGSQTSGACDSIAMGRPLLTEYRSNTPSGEMEIGHHHLIDQD